MTKSIFTEQSNEESCNIDLMNGEEIAKLINNEDKKVALAVEAETKKIGEAIEKIASAFNKGGRLGYFGSGTSGRLGVLDASECPPTFGVEPEKVQGFISGGEKAIRYAVENAEDDENLAVEDLAKFNADKKDVIVGISASGNSKYIGTVLAKAKEKEIVTVAVTTNPEAKFKKYADIFICPKVGAEVVSGSSRMKSGTAQKMVLNMLTTGALIRCGKTYKNYMIDLKITNEKLYKRACRIISEIAEVETKDAEKYLEMSNKNVRLACIMAKKKINLEQAKKLLREKDGILRRIL